MGGVADPDTPLLIGYRHSVYSRAVRIALAELGVAYDWQEADPFSQEVALHPFHRVPVLMDGGTRVFETWAILIYAWARWGADRCQTPLELARAAQVASIANAYAYWPLVRQVYSHAVFRPAMEERGDAAEIAAGHAAADVVLEQFEDICAEGAVLTGVRVGPADCILFPMIDAYCRTREGEAKVLMRPGLRQWWRALAGQEKIAATFAPLKTEG